MSFHHEQLKEQLAKEYVETHKAARGDVRKWMEDAAKKAFGYSWGRVDEAITGAYDGICVNGFGYAYATLIGKVHSSGGGGIPDLRDAWITYTTNTLGKVVPD